MAPRNEVAMPSFPDSDRGAPKHLWLVACAAIDAFAAAMLLVHTPLSPPMAGLLAATVHAAAVALLFGAVRARTSRRSLGAAAALAVPGAGVAVAAAAIITRGRDRVGKRLGPRVRRRAPRAMQALLRLGHALSPCDAMDGGSEEERRTAISALTRRADRDAIALLRRASASDDSELALAAALALDEISERFERAAGRIEAGELRHAAG